MFKLRVIDLMCGLGGRSLAFWREGYEVVLAIDNDIENAEMYNVLCKSPVTLENLSDINPLYLPEAEVILAKLENCRNVSGFNVENAAEEVNDVVYDIIKKRRPLYFVLESAASMLMGRNRTYTDALLYRYIGMGYEVSYKVFNEREYSGFPVNGRRLFFVGIREGLCTFQFPEPVYDEYRNQFLQEEAGSIDFWYRKINRESESFTGKEGEFYRRQRTGFVSTELVHIGYCRENYLTDSVGLRRFMHNELASVKGLTGVDYNRCANRMYQKISEASDFYVVRALANAIYRNLEPEFFVGETIDDRKRGTQKKEKTSSKKTQKVLYPKQRIVDIYIDELKGLHKLDIHIEKNLVALMGTNGAGKSTILHALACAFAPYNNGENYKFSFFFTPNPDASWRNSKFSITYFDENEHKLINRGYKKLTDRWAPRYEKRPARDTYYFGISACIPEIETEKQTSFIEYNTEEDAGKYVEKIIKDRYFVTCHCVEKTGEKTIRNCKGKEASNYIYDPFFGNE